MKKLLLAFTLLLVATSCSKLKEKKYSDLVYYSVDYKETDMSILDFTASDIDALWFEFSSKDKSEEFTNYTLNAKKSNGEFSKESGTCTIDWYNNITFYPSNGDAYVAKWISDKEKFVITYELETRTEDITFIYKEIDKCKKGK